MSAREWTGDPTLLTCEAGVWVGEGFDTCSRPAVKWASDPDGEYPEWPVCEQHA